ncbi:MAG: hypothetical protein RJB39_705 [Candidatus Parcubacteria bacterium]|jgi:uncharacterized protein YdhG (YjbR/CyaY superfamily)
MPKPTTIAEYITSCPKDTQKKLKELLAILRSAAPNAIEGIKWSMPALSYKRMLFAFALGKYHIGLYPTPSPIRAFKKDLTKYKTSVGAIQFPLDKPLPVALIKKIAKFRVKESLEKI